MVKDCRVEVGGSRIHYLQAGSGHDSLILLHGGSYDSARLSWQAVLPGLAGRFSVYAPDLPGFGESELSQQHCNSGVFIRTLRGFVRSMALHRPILVGLSLGGLISIGLTLRDPAVCRALVLVGSAGLHRKMKWRGAANLASRVPASYRLLTRLAASNRAVLRSVLRLHLHLKPSPLLLNEVQQAIRRKGAGAGWRSFLAAEVQWSGFRTCYEEQLGRLQVPTLFVHGRQDRMVPVEHSRKAHLKVRDSELRIVEQCGHWVPRERPEELLRLVLDFLRRRT